MKRKNAQGKDKPQLNRKSPIKAPASKTLDKKWIMIGAAALLTVVILTAGLIWFYGDTTVARINGIPILESEVSRELAQNTSLMQNVEAGTISWRDASEATARQIAFIKLFEDYADRNNIIRTGNETPNALIQSVTNAIIADDSQFASFEAYMVEDEAIAAEIRAAEILAEEILERVLAGEDFDELEATYSGDNMPPGGYIFIEGVMVTEFFEATRNLEIGEISGLVRSEFGFHIIKRIEPPEGSPIAIPGGQAFAPLETDDEILGAKHILINARETPLLERRRNAVAAGFSAKFEAADIVFLRGLNNVPQP